MTLAFDPIKDQMKSGLEKKENKSDWHCAVKNTTTSKDKWYYHLFYDFDNIKLSNNEIDWIVRFMKNHSMSFILRHTQHGYHLIGLTPISAQKWGFCFQELQATFPTYHDGQAIRITKKEIGEFIIVAEDYSYPFSLNLTNKFSKLKLKSDPRAIKESWYVLLYYTTNKKNVKNKEVIARK